MDTIFPTASINIFNVIANVGLILFMFMVGLEIDTKLMSKNVGSALIISVTAMATPFLLVGNLDLLMLITRVLLLLMQFIPIWSMIAYRLLLSFSLLVLLCLSLP